jgi:hypothetical protein
MPENFRSIDSTSILLVTKIDVTKIADGCKYEGMNDFSCATGLIK